MESPDKLFVGQEIIIPKPAAPAENKTQAVNPQANLLNTGQFESVPNMGGRRQNPVMPAAAQGQNNIRWYEVKENDSLWKIAAEQLGKGSRFTEISKLNSDILTDEDKLKLGMRLRLPKE